MFWILFKMFNIFRSKKITPKEPKSGSGSGYILLNVIRVCNIIALATVIAGSWIMLVRTVQTSNFYFFDAFSHLITSAISLFLITSELSLFTTYFATNWPLLSPTSSFLFLGTSMFVLGMNTLGNLNKTATSVENLGLPLWRVVIAGGVLSAVFGVANCIVSFIYTNKSLHITARIVRAHGASPPSLPHPYETKSQTSSPTPSIYQSPPSIHTPEAPRRSLRFDFRNLRSSFISKPIAIVDPERASPIYPHVQRPDTAQHPAMRREWVEEVKPPGRRAYTASQYSIAESWF